MADHTTGISLAAKLRELQRMFGKTIDSEILREAVAQAAGQETPVPPSTRFPVFERLTIAPLAQCWFPGVLLPLFAGGDGTWGEVRCAHSGLAPQP